MYLVIFKGNDVCKCEMYDEPNYEPNEVYDYGLHTLAKDFYGVEVEADDYESAIKSATTLVARYKA